MKKLKLFVPLVAAILLSACSSFRHSDIRIGDTPAAKIAKTAQIPGKGVPGQCLPFAMALHQRFEAAGIPSRVIVYGYEALASPSLSAPGGFVQAGEREAHAVVAYDDRGRTYIMDNQSWSPQWVHGAAPIKMAQQFSGINCNVRMAKVIGDEGFHRELLPSQNGAPIAAD